MNLAKHSIKSLLGMATRAEIDANKTYLKLADRVANPLLKEKFHLLAYEEKKHRKLLEKLFFIMFEGDRMSVPKTVDPALLPAVVIKPSSTFAQIIFQAMAAEQSARDFYLSLAARVKDEKKKILLYLSKVEQSHYLMLRSEHSLALDFEDYAERGIDKVVT
jgi:rubrerythrin